MASEMIAEAVAATRAYFGDPPPLGMVTFINRDKVRPTIEHGRRTWGRTYKLAGFSDDGQTKGGLLALRLPPEGMPGPEAALGQQTALYRFEHSLDKAEASGQRITYTSDLFAQLVMSLEDIARMTERGIYELSAWIAGMKALPSSPPLEPCFVALGFTHRPATEEEVKTRFKQLAKALHPDAGGDDAAFMDLNTNFEAAKAALKG